MTPPKLLLDLALSLAVGWDCLADIGVPRGEPGAYSPVVFGTTA